MKKSKKVYPQILKMKPQTILKRETICKVLYIKVQFLKTIWPHYALCMYVMYCPVKTNHSEKCLPFLFLSVAKARVGKRRYCIGNRPIHIWKYLSDDCRCLYKSSEMKLSGDVLLFFCSFSNGCLLLICYFYFWSCILLIQLVYFCIFLDFPRSPVQKQLCFKTARQ